MNFLSDRVDINFDGESFQRAQACINSKIGGEYGRPIDVFIANGDRELVELLLSKATIDIDLRN